MSEPRTKIGRELIGIIESQGYFGQHEWLRSRIAAIEDQAQSMRWEATERAPADPVVRPDRCPDHVWEAEGEVSQRDLARLRDLLPAAIREGKEIIVAEGVTLRRRDVRAPSPTPVLDPDLLRAAEDVVLQRADAVNPGLVVTSRRAMDRLQEALRLSSESRSK